MKNYYCSDDIVHVNSNIPNYNYFEKFPFLTELMKNEINIHEQISSDNSNDYGYCYFNKND